MLYSNILTKEELEALLAPEELEVFIAEKQTRLEHELMLSPAHLLLSLRELEDMVGKLLGRVEQLEYQLAQKPLQLVPETLQVVIKNDDESKTDELVELQTEIQIEPYIETQIEPHLELQLEPKEEEIENSEAFQRERSILLANEMETIVEIDQISEESVDSIPLLQESGLISRSARHRERKPTFLSKLLK